jgi:hypothetical protein
MCKPLCFWLTDVITEFDGTWEVSCFNVTNYAALTVTGNDVCMEADGPTELNFCIPSYYRGF